MAAVILGLDIGGANLKAATPDRRAASVPFALWKQPDRLPAALAELLARFPDAEELAVTMTGELCDCFETKRDGVNAILAAVRFAGGGRRIRVWSTDGAFVTPDEARADHLKVAAANWHALATFAGRLVETEHAVLIDTGSTTTDIVPLRFGVPVPWGRTDPQRLALGELVYLGVRRTPVCAAYQAYVCAELFATTQDVYVVLGQLPEDPACVDTADGRPLTADYSFARLARMLGGDAETVSRERLLHFAARVDKSVVDTIAGEVRNACVRTWDTFDRLTVVVSGAGEFLARRSSARCVAWGGTVDRVVSLNDELGPGVSACAPAHAVAVLAAELRP